MHAAASEVIRSPAITTGTAGGQLTQASARTRPAARSAAIVSRGESIACRMEQTLSGTGSAGGLSVSGSLCGMSRRTEYRDSRSESFVSAEIISTRFVRSANSHSMPFSRRAACSSSPLYPRAAARSVSFSGSVPVRIHPSFRRAFLISSQEASLLLSS